MYSYFSFTDEGTEAQKRVYSFCTVAQTKKAELMFYFSAVPEPTCIERRGPKKEPPAITQFKGWIKEGPSERV